MKPVSDATRIQALRDAIRAANGDWHDLTNLWSVQADLDWLLARAELGVLDVERLAQAMANATGWITIEPGDQLSIEGKVPSRPMSAKDHLPTARKIAAEYDRLRALTATLAARP